MLSDFLSVGYVFGYVWYYVFFLFFFYFFFKLRVCSGAHLSWCCRMGDYFSCVWHSQRPISFRHFSLLSSFRGLWEVWRGSVTYTASSSSHESTLPRQLFLLYELSSPPAGHAVLWQGRLPWVWGLLYGEDTHTESFWLVKFEYFSWFLHYCDEFHVELGGSFCLVTLFLLPFFPQNSLAVCSRCGEKITDRVLKAVGQCFHAHCFRCSTCSCILEGAPFITDDNNNPYCVQDYHR